MCIWWWWGWWWGWGGLGWGGWRRRWWRQLWWYIVQYIRQYLPICAHIVYILGTLIKPSKEWVLFGSAHKFYQKREGHWTRSGSVWSQRDGPRRPFETCIDLFSIPWSFVYYIIWLFIMLIIHSLFCFPKSFMSWFEAFLIHICVCSFVVSHLLTYQSAEAVGSRPQDWLSHGSQHSGHRLQRQTHCYAWKVRIWGGSRFLRGKAT